VTGVAMCAALIRCACNESERIGMVAGSGAAAVTF
jgi:hypothetical protein